MSSGHMTGGYYDTLTTCWKEAPVTDEDIRLFTCGAEVDFISFRLGYYDQPRLPVEYLTAEAEAGNFRQTSPSRWVWDNPYGADEEQIKDFLRSVRYHADWDSSDAEQSRERVVKVTMHVGEDSTTSWTVYQLEQDEVYAGRDTVIAYCPDVTSLDLEDYLSPEAIRGGRIVPELAAGGMIFTPGTDADTTYLYIVEGGECADTAELQTEAFTPDVIDLDTVFLCPGESTRIGFPPGQYELTWWDRSRGDSIQATQADEGRRQISIQQGDCGIQIEVEIVVRDLTGMAGKDQIFPYCEGGTEIALLDALPAYSSMEGRIEGLPTGIFRPGVDDPGEYLYIISTGSCADTAILILSPTSIQEIPSKEVEFCAGEEIRIGLPTGTYDEITWENGAQGDSIEIMDAQEGSFGFEALKDGCTYQGIFEIRLQSEIVFPDLYGEPVTLCEGKEKFLPMIGLDSIRWQGQLYVPGEGFPVREGDVPTLTGYLDGCSAETSLTIETVPDPSVDYRISTELCEGEVAEIRLPAETNDLRFEWEDGSPESVRSVDQPGDYSFLILFGDCIFEGAVEVTVNRDCEPEADRCEISLPNVIVPNGENNALRVYSTCEIRVQEIRVFDKWGGQQYVGQVEEVAYEVWESLPPDVYVVEVIYEQEGKEVRRMTGSVMVVK